MVRVTSRDRLCRSRAHSRHGERGGHIVATVEYAHHIDTPTLSARAVITNSLPRVDVALAERVIVSISLSPFAPTGLSRLNVRSGVPPCSALTSSTRTSNTWLGA